MKISIEKTLALKQNIIIPFNDARNDFEQLKEFVKHLGVHSANDSTQFIFWTPEVKNANFDCLALEIYRPKVTIDFEKNIQNIDFEVFTLAIQVENELAYGVYEGIKIGNETQVGDFYQLFSIGKNGNRKKIYDTLSYSIPFGAFSPAEVFDFQTISKNRKDEIYLKNIGHKAPYPANILEMHIPTTTKGGTIQDLAIFYKNIDKKENISSFEKTFLGYDAVELMPLQPLCEHEGKEGFWQEKNRENNTISVELQSPNTQNWGYDIVISASSAINPNLLKTKRPHELVHLLEVLHNFSDQAIQVILDVVYGHADGPAVKILNNKFIAGDGMYGKVLNYKHLLVRAILLESMRRMANYGIDGFRIDASQDINNWNDTLKKIVYDDAFLKEIDNIKATVCGVTYKPFIIFEDGRPWPERGWALKQSYREVTQMLPDTIQWSPLTFADNNPHIFNFWQYKFFRIKEICEYGERWLTGSSNHDSLRKGAQQNPFEAPMNVFFSEKRNEIFHKGYNAPAAKLLEYFLPGTPMDFVQSNVGAPWLFMRNTDEQWGLKVVSEEVNFVNWFLDEEKYQQNTTFSSVKKLGYEQFWQFQNFMNDLSSIIKITNYDWVEMIKTFNQFAPKRYPTIGNPSDLKAFAKAFMEDAHDFCNAEHYQNQDDSLNDFLFNLRILIKRNHWLSKNLYNNSTIEIIPMYGATAYKISRYNPSTKQF